jgi:acyl-CoA synthetase (NDP forming)
MIVGVAHDPQFGPVVACGAGGVMVELVTDVSVRLTPLSREDAAEMVRELRTYPLLEGYRGSPRRDIAALEDVILRVSALADDIPAIAELDLNPVFVHERGATVVDARIRLSPHPKPTRTRSRVFLRRALVPHISGAFTREISWHLTSRSSSRKPSAPHTI